MSEIECDVAVVGGGPVGVTLLNLLGVHGVSAAGFEREPAAGHSPRAGTFDDEVMRIFQAAGLSGVIEPTVSPGVGLRLENEAGTTLLAMDNREAFGPQGWSVTYRMYQPTLERLLRDGLERFPNVALHSAHEVTAVGQDESHAWVDVRDLASGEQRRVTARYVIGCDGASSSVRARIGARFECLAPDQPYLVVDAAPTRELDLPREGTLFCWPSRPHYWRGLAPWLRWELKVMPGDDPAELTTPAAVFRLLESWITPDDADIERAVIYTFHSLLADRWRNGRVLLAGDAAHVQPPFMGQGLCSGIRDVANLSWKLGWVLRGEAGDDLLDSYQIERSPHARAWIGEATRIGEIVTAVDPAAAAERDSRILAGSRELAPIMPRLGPGLHGHAPEPAGTLSPQPRRSDARRLDDIVGLGFGVIARTDLALTVPAMPHVVVVAEPAELVGPVLATYDAAAVVIRPDRYVLGVAHDVVELGRL
ncbi:MAG: bifunctional 3-(3-hydroxy-phenyl)propionate/3-hydroxycinnamic acid hydroxylase, partial [Solirubrobacteraceae bacterium]